MKRQNVQNMQNMHEVEEMVEWRNGGIVGNCLLSG